MESGIQQDEDVLCVQEVDEVKVEEETARISMWGD